MKEIGSRSDRVEMLSNILALFTLSLKGSIFVHVAAQAEANCRSYIGDILASSNEDKKKMLPVLAELDVEEMRLHSALLYYAHGSIT